MIPALYRANLGYLTRHPLQLALALLGICAGVAVVVAIDLANESSRKAFRLSMDSLNGAATHQIVAGPGGLDESFYRDLRVEHGVRNIAPIVSGYVRTGGESLQLIGVDIFAERAFRNYAAVANNSQNLVSGDITESQVAVRRILTVPGAVLVPQAVADRFGWRIDERVPVIANGVEQEAIVVGIIGAEEGANLSNVIVADISSSQEWLGMQGLLTRIDVRAPGEASLAAIRRLLPEGYSILNAAGRSASTIAMSEAFTTNLMALSLLALMVGIFLIYNSVAFSVLQRRSLIGIWRAIGVTRGQVFKLILAEAVLLGAIGATVGVLLGILLGQQLVGLVAGTISDHYFMVTVTDVAVDATSLAKGIFAGLGATVLAAAVPCYEAASYPPRLSLSRSVIEQKAGRSLPYLAMGGLAAIGVAGLILMLSGTNLLAGLVAVFAIILGYALCIPVAVRYVVSLMAARRSKSGRAVSRLAVDGVAKSLSRTGVAIVALAIAVSATIGVSVMVKSFRGSVETWLNDTLQSDVYVGVVRGSIDLDLLDDLTGVAGVVEYSTSRRSWIETENERTRIIALQMAPGSYRGIGIRNDDPDTVWRQFDDENAVLVSDAFAFKRNVQAGDEIALLTVNGSEVFRIAAIYQSFDANDGALIMSRTAYDQHFDDPRIDSIGLYLEPGVDPEKTMALLREVNAGRQSLIMNSNTKIRELSLRVFDRTFVITNVLYWLAVGVAVVGILGTLLALQLERTREFGVLRGIGMTPKQIRMLVTSQSAIIGLFSGLAALPLGVAMAYLLIKVINRRAFGWQMDLSVSLADLFVAVLLAVAAAVVAGIYPAMKAARIRPALAMREE